MKILIKNKKGGKIAGKIHASELSQHCILEIQYQSKPQFLEELQRLLLKYWDLIVISGEGVIKNKYLLNDVKIKKTNKTRLTQTFRTQERYKTDVAFKERRKEREKEWLKKNPKRVRERQREKSLILSKFADKHCITCDKLLDYRTKGKFCRKCWRR